MSEAEIAILDLLAQRGDAKTICPSEAARQLAGDNEGWRDRMSEVHEAVDTMLSRGMILLSWKGTLKSERRGPYRIARRKLLENSDDHIR